VLIFSVPPPRLSLLLFRIKRGKISLFAGPLPIRVSSAVIGLVEARALNAQPVGNKALALMSAKTFTPALLASSRDTIWIVGSLVALVIVSDHNARASATKINASACMARATIIAKSTKLPPVQYLFTVSHIIHGIVSRSAARELPDLKKSRASG
jgi:hypothetical protein